MGGLVFLGTPAFAVPTLQRLVESGRSVKAVFTQPDRPRGRGGQVSPSPVKEAAQRLGLCVSQPERVRRPEVVEQLRAMNPDVMVVVGYGQIIPQNVIDIPPLGIINVHASLLPKYRGAAPIQWAIANGEEITGVTTMRINAGLDTGDILLKWETVIGPEENAPELSERLSHAGADLLIQTLAGLESGSLQPEPQDHSQASLAPILKKEDGQIDWSVPAKNIYNRARGFLPWPGAYSRFRGQLFHVWRAKPLAIEEPEKRFPGTLYSVGNRLVAACGHATGLELLEVQIEGRKRLPAAAFLNGHRLTDDEVLGVESS